MGVKLKSSSGGSVEIAAPVTASNYTLTAPAVTSTVDTLARTGNVLQVVQAVNSTVTLSSSTSFSATGLTAAITPISLQNKVLVIVNGQVYSQSTANSAAIAIYRNNSTNLLSARAAYGGTSTVSVFASLSYLDSPATTSATSYTVYLASSSGSTVAWNSGADNTTITLMEIAG